jgi:hypothetical protein
MEYPAIHEYDDDHRLIKLTIGQLLELPIENWKHNRPPDEVRFAEIEAFIQKRNNEILQPFYINYNSETDIYEVVDGIHRYSAIKAIKDSHVLDKILDKIVFVHLFIDISYGALIDIFNNLNKTVPLPELYIGKAEDNTNKKEIIEETVEQWKIWYKSHFSSSTTSCQIPNIIRDAFINILSELYTSYKVRSKTKLLELLECANSNIRDYVLAGISLRTIPIKFSEQQKQKCSKSGCYLFLYRDVGNIKYFIDKDTTSVVV